MVGFYEARKTYWDYRVKELCRKDGGVQIFEKLILSNAAVTLQQLTNPQAPAYAERRVTEIRAWNPRVERIEWIVVRRSDQRAVARWTVYGRGGGDIPTGFSHPSSFGCPDAGKIGLDLQSLFVIEGEPK